MRQRRPRLFVLIGPTGVGKTESLIEICSGSAEVVNADSMQVYRELFIGVAKPSFKERATLPHHLIDILSFRDSFNVGDFVRRARVLIQQIREKGKIPIVSGGTPFYIKHLLSGLPGLPPPSREIREELKRDLKEKGIEALREELRRVDPVSFCRLGPKDAFRHARALEVYRMTGKPLSNYRSSHPLKQEYSVTIVGLQRERRELEVRIERRVEEMFEKGLPREVAQLIAQGAKDSDPGMRGIGYKEFFTFPKEQIKGRITTHTRQYAKRQMTFFRSFPGVKWLHPSQREDIQHEWKKVALDYPI